MIIDVYNHLYPKSFVEFASRPAFRHAKIAERVQTIPELFDIDRRLAAIERHADYTQILSIAGPPIEAIASGVEAADLAEAANDGLKDLVDAHPSHFAGFIATLPMNDPEASLREIDRCVGQLGAVGVQFYTNVNGRPLDAPEFEPLFARMAALDRPVWIHPARGPNAADYRSEEASPFGVWFTLGWPYETSVAMSRIVIAGLFDRYPDLKIITHHMGGMIPYFEGRLGAAWEFFGQRTGDRKLQAAMEKLEARPIDYFRKFYADTALFGARGATVCGLEFFGPERVVFASDFPFDPPSGPSFIDSTMRIVEQLDVTPEDRERIFSGNARALMGLD